MPSVDNCIPICVQGTVLMCICLGLGPAPHLRFGRRGQNASGRSARMYRKCGRRPKDNFEVQVGMRNIGTEGIVATLDEGSEAALGSFWCRIGDWFCLSHWFQLVQLVGACAITTNRQCGIRVDTTLP